MSPADDGKNEGFLSAWSRRKLAVRRQEAEAEQSPDQDEKADVDTQAADDAADIGDGPAVDETGGETDSDAVDADFVANLPSIEDITGRTDLAPFMRRGVPLALRNAALRKVWTLNPLIRDHIDPALDYAWDWNAPGGVPGGGGTLTGEGVSQMVKNLMGDAKPADVANRALRAGDTAPDDATPDDEAETAELSADQSAEPVRRSDVAGADLSDAESSDTDSDAGTDEGADEETRVKMTLPSARRHGGALPE